MVSTQTNNNGGWERLGVQERQGQTVLMKLPGSTEEIVPFSCGSREGRGQGSI